MDTLPILYNVVFRCHENVGSIFLIDVMFCKVHRIGPRNMCVDFERNRLRIEDFRKSEKIVFFLWRDVARKRDVVRQNLREAYRSAILWGMFSNQPKVSTTSGSKVMAHYVIFTKVVTLTLIFIRFSPKNFARVLGTEYISCKNFGKIEPVVWPVHRSITDRQTDRQTAVTNILCKNLRFCKVTNRGDQYTLQKSTILQSNKPRWPIYFAKIYDFAK